MKDNLYIGLLATTMFLSTNVIAQTCKTDSIVASTPDSRFEIMSNGTEVKDQQTGLIWQRCSMGRTWDGNTCSGKANVYDLQDALVQVKSLGSGYRLPNVKEMSSIVERQCSSPAINSNIFPRTQSGYDYITSSPHRIYNQNIWFLSFEDGSMDSGKKTNRYQIRAVRDE